MNRILTWLYDRLTRKPRGCYLCAYCHEPVYGILVDHLDQCLAFRHHMNRMWEKAYASHTDTVDR